MYGEIVIESKFNFSKKALAYIFDVLPISALLASAMVNKSG